MTEVWTFLYFDTDLADGEFISWSFHSQSKRLRPAVEIRWIDHYGSRSRTLVRRTSQVRNNNKNFTNFTRTSKPESWKTNGHLPVVIVISNFRSGKRRSLVLFMHCHGQGWGPLQTAVNLIDWIWGLGDTRLGLVLTSQQWPTGTCFWNHDKQKMCQLPSWLLFVCCFAFMAALPSPGQASFDCLYRENFLFHSMNYVSFESTWLVW